MKKVILKLIKFYQITISPDHGFFSNYKSFRGCRFYPSCSEFLYQAIEKKGLIRGIFIGLKRLLRCHPLSPGGYDPLK